MFIFTVGMTRLSKQPAGEGCQRGTALCFGIRQSSCSGTLTSQHIKKIGITQRDLLGKPLAAWKCCLGAKSVFFHQSSPEPHHCWGALSGKAAARCEAQLQDTVMLAQHPFLPEEQHFSLWTRSSALIQHFCCLFYFLHF